MPFDGQFAELLPIRRLVNLTDLDISENCFAVLPDWIGELTQLVTQWSGHEPSATPPVSGGAAMLF